MGGHVEGGRRDKISERDVRQVAAGKHTKKKKVISHTTISIYSD